ncbi:MAG: hypothetical protein M1821_003307 [Bathelium mastoideum]|nr:MAG: hypothetical protein M1821_003307 [Bathelium mastoideum]KAI9689337.1 MAG: hypothetical protein M1822_009988 [Bathelium mastoideum]
MPSLTLPTYSIPTFLPLAQALGLTAPAAYAALTHAYNAIVLPPLLLAHDDDADASDPNNDHDARLAKQWLCAYQYGPVFVPPLLLAATLGNGVAAGCALARWLLLTGRIGSLDGHQGGGGAAAAVATALGAGHGHDVAGTSSSSGAAWALGAALAHTIAVLAFVALGPYTLKWMERGINGAAKWKAQQVLAPSWRDGAQGKEEERRWVMPEEETDGPSAHTHTAREPWRAWAEGVSMREIVVTWGEWNAPRAWIGVGSMVASAIGLWMSG